MVADHFYNKKVTQFHVLVYNIESFNFLFADHSDRADSPMEERPDALVGEEYPGVGVGSATAAELDRHKALSEEAKKVYNDLQFGRLNIICVSHVPVRTHPGKLQKYRVP